MTASTLVKSSLGKYQVGSLQVGDRVVIQPQNLSQRRQYLAHATGEIKSITATKASVLLDEPANKAYKPHTVKVDLCSLIWICSRESEDFRLQQKQLEELGQLNLLNSIQMPNESCDRTSQESPSTAISKTFPPELENTTCTQSASPAPAPALQATEQDSTTQNQACGLKPCDASPTASPISSSSKILRGLSVEDFEQCLEDCEWSDIVGTIHKSFQQRNLERRTSAKGFSSLPTPTTYAKGSTGSRPAGATRLEQSLRKFIAKGDKLHPAAPGWMMGFPPGWVEEVLMAGGQATHLQLPFIPECVTTQPLVESATTSTPDPSAPCKQRSQLNESVTSPNSSQQLKKSNIKVDLYICDRSSNVGIIKSCCSTYFVVDWKTEKDKWYFWERDELYIAELAIAPQPLIAKFLEEKPSTQEPLILCPSCESQYIYLSGGCGMCGLEPDMERTQQLQSLQIAEGLRPAIGQRVRILKTRTQNLSQWIGKTATVTGINGETISVAAGEGKEKKHLTLKKGWYELIPENSSEENKEAVTPAQQPKLSKQKGCLYKYIENKKLKDGSIVSYPRVIGHRQPDNPNHWRWGFNWEIKVDGEWKGRSINSIPVGVIPMIQEMQKEGVPLEEIIGFIKRAKSKR
jgi:hypothetical protein